MIRSQNLLIINEITALRTAFCGVSQMLQNYLQQP